MKICKLNEENIFKQKVKHESFIKQMFDVIYFNESKRFIKNLKNYYRQLNNKEQEILSVLTLRVRHGFIEESLLDYIDVHIINLNCERSPLNTEDIYRWELIKNKLTDFVECKLNQSL